MTHNQIEYRCAKCNEGFYQHSMGDECKKPAENHCTYVNSVATGKIIGMEKLSGKEEEVCVDKCPEGSVPN